MQFSVHKYSVSRTGAAAGTFRKGL